MNSILNKNKQYNNTSASLDEFDLINKSYNSTSLLLNSSTTSLPPQHVVNSPNQPILTPLITPKSKTKNITRPINIVTINVQDINNKTKQKLLL